MADTHNEDDFVKNDGEEGEDSIDGFEEQVNKTIKQSQNRPQSKSGKEESSRYNPGSKKVQPQQPQQEEAQNEGQEAPSKNKKIYDVLKKQTSATVNPVIQKMSKYIAFHHISLESFWKSSKIYASLDEFFGYCLETGLILQENELIGISEELCDEQGFVTIELICQKIQPWNYQENAMLEFIREKVLGMVNTSKKRFRVASHNQKMQQNEAKNQIRPSTGTVMQASKLSSSLVSQGQKQSQYLQKYKDKQNQQETILSAALSKNQSEEEYDILIKMGESNEIQSEMSKNRSYRAFKTEQGNMLVHVYEGDQFVQSMTLNEFRREYNSLKYNYNQSRNLKSWEILYENKKTNKTRDFSKNVTKQESVLSQEAEKTTGIDKKTKSTRQQELKKVLLETMWLTNILNEQSNILNKKGINIHSLNLNKSMFSAAPSKSPNASQLP